MQIENLKFEDVKPHILSKEEAEEKFAKIMLNNKWKNHFLNHNGEEIKSKTFKVTYRNVHCLIDLMYNVDVESIDDFEIKNEYFYRIRIDNKSEDFITLYDNVNIFVKHNLIKWLDVFCVKDNKFLQRIMNKDYIRTATTDEETFNLAIERTKEFVDYFYTRIELSLRAKNNVMHIYNKYFGEEE